MHIVVVNKEHSVNESMQSAPLSLPKGGVSVFSDATSTQIRCEAGALWVTQDNDTRDIVIQAGEQFQPDRRGNVVVYALEQSSLSIAPAQEQRTVSVWRAIADWMAGGRLPSLQGRRPAFE
jgi:Protein of unknown function (DUF2917)